MEQTIMRGDMYYANLNPVIGSEQGGTRPVLIIQNDMGNKYSPTVIIAPITSKTKSEQPTHILLTVATLPKDSVVLLEQIRTIDKKRLREYIGTLDDAVMRDINHAISVSVDLKQRNRESLVMTLCFVCAGQFYNLPGHTIRRVDQEQSIQDTCTFCNTRRGYDYEITRS